jgi:hypothetical protein
MQFRIQIQSFLCLALLAMAAPSLAVTVTYSYIMDQSNALPDEVDYLSVTISNDTAGQLDFWVETLSALDDIAGDNYGIQSFGFSYSDLLPPAGDDKHDNKDSLPAIDFILPDGWRVQYNKNMSEAGRFDARIMGTGNSREESLHFSVIGLSLYDVTPYFAAHVAGFDLALGECDNDDRCGDRITSAFFYGGREDVVVPVPAAALLFGSGLLGLVGIARRKKA